MARHWRQLLELKLRRSSKEGFQTFLGEFMERVYPDDYVRIRPHGNKGDGGRDGYRRSTNTLYQCFGADNGHVTRIDSVCKKLKSDFKTAVENHKNMKVWLFTHNLIEVSDPLYKCLEEIEPEAKQRGITTGIFALENFKKLLPNLSNEDLEELIGIGSFNAEDIEKLPSLVNEIIEQIMGHITNEALSSSSIRPVPADKMDFNKIPQLWRTKLNQWIAHSPIVEDILANYPKESAAELAPAFLNEKYEQLKMQGLGPGAILDELLETLAGYVIEHDGRYEAAMLVLASMFESCIIFEDKDKRTCVENGHDIAK